MPSGNLFMFLSLHDVESFAVLPLLRGSFHVSRTTWCSLYYCSTFISVLLNEFYLFHIRYYVLNNAVGTSCFWQVAITRNCYLALILSLPIAHHGATGYQYTYSRLCLSSQCELVTLPLSCKLEFNAIASDVS